MLEFFKAVDSFLGTYILVPGLLLAGLYFTLLLGAPQVTKLGKALKQTFGGIFKKSESGKGSISSFQALATAVAAQIGTGNVAGVATAIATGGPGAIFWMWVSALMGMSTIFAEAILAQVYRENQDGQLVGGPAYYISKGLGKKNKALGKGLAVLFAVSIIFALGFVGNMVQSNSIATAVTKAFPVPALGVGVALAIAGGLIFIGGMKRIGRFAELVVPFMALVYIVLSVAILVMFRNELGHALSLIFKGAFTGQAALGGFAGATMKSAIKMGVQRGLFSNEAGMGSTPHAHAVALVRHPVDQGLSALVGVFIDTLVVCTATALIILVTQSYTVEGLSGAAITQQAFTTAFGTIGQSALAICLTFFAFTTIVGWYYFGETNIRFLFGSKALTPYRILVMAAIIFGSLQEVELVWKMSDVANELMVIPNILALLALSFEVKTIFKDYQADVAAGKLDYDYAPEARASEK